MEREKRPIFHSDVVRGGLVLTLTMLFVALIPILGPAVVILTPLPILYYYTRLGRWKGMLLLAISLLTTSGILVLLGQGLNLPVLFMIGFAGVLFSEVLKRRLSIEKTILAATLAMFGCGVSVVLYHAFRSDIGLWRILETYVAGIVQDNIKLYSQLNLGEEQVRLLKESAPQITRLFTGIFPALSLSGAVFTVWLNLLVARPLFRTNGLPFPDFGDWSAWKSPETLVWVLIASGGMMLIPDDVASIIGMNGLILCCLLYLFQGLAIVAYFFRLKQIPLFFRGLFYTLLLIQQYMLLIVIAFGLFDMWVDFRKRIGGIKDPPA